MSALNVEIPDDLRRRLKAECATEGVSVKDAVVTAIQSWLESKSPASEGGLEAVRIPTKVDIPSSTPPVIEVESTGTGKGSKLEPGDKEWLEMLAFVLSFGDQATKDAITRNIERFHYLTTLLRGAPGESDPQNAGPAPIPADHEGRMDLVREIAARHGIDTEGLRGDAEGSNPEKGKHSRAAGTRRKH